MNPKQVSNIVTLLFLLNGAVNAQTTEMTLGLPLTSALSRIKRQCCASCTNDNCSCGGCPSQSMKQVSPSKSSLGCDVPRALPTALYELMCYGNSLLSRAMPANVHELVRAGSSTTTAFARLPVLGSVHAELRAVVHRSTNGHAAKVRVPLYAHMFTAVHANCPSAADLHSVMHAQLSAILPASNAGSANDDYVHRRLHAELPAQLRAGRHVQLLHERLSCDVRVRCSTVAVEGLCVRVHAKLRSELPRPAAQIAVPCGNPCICQPGYVQCAEAMCCLKYKNMAKKFRKMKATATTGEVLHGDQERELRSGNQIQQRVAKKPTPNHWEGLKMLR
ncbi:unnamed protein product [Heligmosomoides polygyrus]|uniref:WAP domain-containing protein n=1 Tax=Heligmosomoides polygyrus TaxID=6339 RepID=A0A183F3Z9_HELPZ|nr:unnamed protein product [Heligmosomoides polygyrus]